MGRKPAPEPLTLPGIAATEDPPSAETLPISSTTPQSDTRSPRSPLASFKFAPKKSRALERSRPMQASDAARQQQQQQQQQQALQPQGSLSSTTLRPTDSQASLENSSLPRRLRHNHQRQDEEKASKSGFFFNFAKSSRSSDRLQASQPQHLDLPNEDMSRGSNPHTANSQRSQELGSFLRSLYSMSREAFAWIGKQIGLTTACDA
jgi:hypothetical protein